MKLKILFLIISISLLAVRSDSVCDLDTLRMELKQDLADNGMLDSLRFIEPPHFVEETAKQKNLRLAAEWNTACSFESSYNWKEELKREFKINHLVDSVGEVNDKNNENQADMCEIVRASLAQNLYGYDEVNMQSVPRDVINKISCAGLLGETESEYDTPTSRICAANGVSYFNKKGWVIFLKSSAIEFGNNPRFVRVQNEAEFKMPNPYSRNTGNSEIEVAKSLMHYSKEQLQMHEGDIKNIIDNNSKKVSI